MGLHSLTENVSPSLRVLCLDGGGSKGAYTLGALKELETLLGGRPLSDQFQLVYGSSTGAIIGAMIGLSYSVDDIVDVYLKLAEAVLKPPSAADRSAALAKEGVALFHDRGFGDFKTMVGIVTTNYDMNRPTIFKSTASQTFSRHGSFIPGFGCRIQDVLQASAAAIPYFEPVTLETQPLGRVRLIDGGFVANNPTMFALVDAIGGLGYQPSQIHVLSFGTGSFPVSAPRMTMMDKAKYYLFKKGFPIEILQRAFEANARATELIVPKVFPQLAYARISGEFSDQRFATNFLDGDIDKMKLLFSLGRDSFGKSEAVVRAALSV